MPVTFWVPFCLVFVAVTLASTSYAGILPMSTSTIIAKRVAPAVSGGSTAWAPPFHYAAPVSVFTSKWQGSGAKKSAPLLTGKPRNNAVRMLLAHLSYQLYTQNPMQAIPKRSTSPTAYETAEPIEFLGR